MRFLRLVVVTSLVVGGSSSVFAQPADPAQPVPAGPPGAAPPPEPAPAPAPVIAPAPAPAPVVVEPPPAQTSTVDLGVVNDANSGRSWLAPTALTAPAGTWSFSDYELLLVSGSYAITDQVGLSLTTMIPVTDQFFWVMLSGKAQILKAGSVRLALQGGITYTSYDGGDTTDSFTAGEVGGALTVCIDAECNSHLNGFLGAGFAQADQSAVPFIAAGSLVMKVARRVKLVFEADTGFILGDINETTDGFLFWYGLRFTSRNIGVDVGLMKPIIDGDTDTGSFPLGFPFVSFTYRALRGD